MVMCDAESRLNELCPAEGVRRANLAAYSRSCRPRRQPAPFRGAAREAAVLNGAAFRYFPILEVEKPA